MRYSSSGILFLAFLLSGCANKTIDAPVELRHGVAGGTSYGSVFYNQSDYIEDEETTEAVNKAISSEVGNKSRALTARKNTRKNARNSKKRSFAPEFVFVKRGDTLYGIADKFNINGEEIININGLKPPYDLQPGQKLYIRQ